MIYLQRHDTCLSVNEKKKKINKDFGCYGGILLPTTGKMNHVNMQHMFKCDSFMSTCKNVMLTCNIVI